MSGSTLSNAVSQLVRASMGSSVPNSVPDDELDRHVTELILQEAKQKEDRYGTVGLRAYLPATFPENAVPKANKRFLSSVIRNTDDHNKTLLRAQALAAAEAKERKDEEDRRQRIARAREAADSRSRHRHRHRYRDEEREARSHQDSGRHRSSKRKERSWDRHSASDDEVRPTRRHRTGRSPSSEDKGKRRDLSRPTSKERSSRSHRKHRHRHDSGERRGRDEDKRPRSKRRTDSLEDRAKDTRYDSGNDSYEIHKSPHHRNEKSRLLLRDSLSPSLNLESPNHVSITRDERTPTPAPPSMPKSHNQDLSSAPLRSAPNSKFKPIVRPRSPTPPVASGSGSSRTVVSRSRSHSPIPVYSSKMDRYFTDNYDPRLDTVPLSKRPKVPKDGLIPAEEFEGWDTMLELIKLRRQDKAEKKRSDIVYGVDDVKKKKKKKGEKGVELVWQAVEKKRQALSEQEPGVMDIRYQRKGAVREWDMGKVDVELL